jgi:DDE superfamily endonuclease
MARHRHQEFLRFLNAVEAAVPAGKIIHAILDNYGSHKHPKVHAWLGRHPRWTFHFTPTSGSWLNAVETFFSAMTRRRLRRGVFHSLVDLQAAINRYLDEHNADPKPFTWTATPAAISAKLNQSECAAALGCVQPRRHSPTFPSLRPWSTRIYEIRNPCIVALLGSASGPRRSIDPMRKPLRHGKHPSVDCR